MIVCTYSLVINSSLATNKLKPAEPPAAHGLFWLLLAVDGTIWSMI